MKRNVQVVLGLVIAATLVACEKAPQKAAERMAEKAIESAMEKDGTKAKVNLSSSGAQITTTDAEGKTSQLQIGTAGVTESELGVPFYPGTKPLDGGVSRVSTPDGSAITVLLHSDDAPTAVATFYRERLKAQAEGRQLMDMSGGDGNTMLVLADDKTKATIQVHVNKAEKGTDIQIMSAKSAGK